MNIIIDQRQTGKTTKLLETAKEELQNNNFVFFFAHTFEKAKWLKKDFVCPGKDVVENSWTPPRIRYESGTFIDFRSIGSVDPTISNSLFRGLESERIVLIFDECPWHLIFPILNANQHIIDPRKITIANSIEWPSQYPMMDGYHSTVIRI